jgi:hypothetical protein
LTMRLRFLDETAKDCICIEVERIIPCDATDESLILLNARKQNRISSRWYHWFWQHPRWSYNRKLVFLDIQSKRFTIYWYISEIFSPSKFCCISQDVLFSVVFFARLIANFLVSFPINHPFVNSSSISRDRLNFMPLIWMVWSLAMPLKSDKIFPLHGLFWWQ